MTRKAITVGGMEYARTVLGKAFGDQTAHQLLEKITRSLKNQAFSFSCVRQKQRISSLYCSTSVRRPLQSYFPISIRIKQQMSLCSCPRRYRLQSYRALRRWTAYHLLQSRFWRKNCKRSSLPYSKRQCQGWWYRLCQPLSNNVDRSSEKSIFEGLEVENGELAQEIRKRMFGIQGYHYDGRSFGTAFPA